MTEKRFTFSTMRLQLTSATTPNARERRRTWQSADNRNLFFGLALLVTLFADVSPLAQQSALSTIITGSNDPSALQQLATFSALQEEAEEQNLDWGSLARLSVKEDNSVPPRPRNAIPPTSVEEANAAVARTCATASAITASALTATTTTATATATSVSTSILTAEDVPRGAGEHNDLSASSSTPSAAPSEGEEGSGGSCSTSSSRRRPHRRQHRKKTGPTAAGTSTTVLEGGGLSCSTMSNAPLSVDGGEGEGKVKGGGKEEIEALSLASSACAAVSQAVTTCVQHNHPIWSQFHVMEVAYSTQDNNFIHITERFVQYQKMYPVVYQCAVNEVVSPSEVELLSYPEAGLQEWRSWSCANCGRQHDLVRESCLRCRAPSHFAKLFFGQAVKEVDCTQSLIRFLYATHPHVPLCRVECHRDGSGRGKGCASVYVRREDAAELIEKLNKNVFFDVADDAEARYATGHPPIIAHYVYAQQQGWLEQLVQQRKHSAAARANRPAFLPRSTLVVEESVSLPHDGRSAAEPTRRRWGMGMNGTGFAPPPESAMMPSMTSFTM